MIKKKKEKKKKNECFGIPDLIIFQSNDMIVTLFLYKMPKIAKKEGNKEMITSKYYSELKALKFVQSFVKTKKKKKLSSFVYLFVFFETKMKRNKKRNKNLNSPLINDRYSMTHSHFHT